MNKIPISEAADRAHSSSIPSCSSSSSLHSTSRSQQFVVREMTRQVHSSQSRLINHLSYREFSREEIIVKQQQAQTSSAHQSSLEAIPTLPDSGSRFGFFDTWITRGNTLRKLLVAARGNSSSDSITKAELESVLEACRGASGGYFETTSKSQIIGFRILHYLAEHRWHLSGTAIDLLQSTCRNTSTKSFPYAAMALGYAICHDPRISDQDDLLSILNHAVDELWRLNKTLFLEAVVVLLVAKVKLGNELTDSDLEKIRQAMSEPNSKPNEVQIAPLYSKSTPILDYPEVERKGTYTDTMRFLKALKNHVKHGNVLRAGKTLSCGDLNWLIHHYVENPGPDYRTRSKILQIIRHAVLNGQMIIPNPKFEELLKEALGEFEFKLRTRALVIVGSLAANDRIASEDLKKQFASACYRQRYYAMSALRSHLERIDRSQFLGVETWKSLLNAIDSTSQMSISDIKKMDDLRLLVRYILFLFDKTTNDSGGLLCHPDFCVLLIEAFFIKARDGDEIPPASISEIIDLIINYKHFPLSVLINATATIRYIAENQRKKKRDLPADAMIRVVEDAIKTVNHPELDIHLKEASLRLLGVMLPDYPDNAICQPLLLGLIDSLGNKKLLSTSCTVLSAWVNTIKAPHFHKEFSRLFEKIDILLATDLSIKKKTSLMSLLGRAAEKGFSFSDQLIDNLILNALSSKNLSLQQSCARMMAAVLGSQTKMRWSQNFFDLLILLCQSVDKKDLMNDFSLLCHYMKLLEKPLTDPQMDQLAVLLCEKKTVELACEVFLELVERGWPINEKCLDLLVNIILDDGSQAQLAATSLLEATAEKGQVFSKKVMERVIQGLSSDREEVVLSCVMMLNKRNIASLRSNDGALAWKSLESLMTIATTGYNPSNIRFKACSVLIHFSEKSFLSFPVPLLEPLIGLLSDQNEKIRVLAMRLLSLQIPHLGVPISNGNTCITEIVDGVIPCLRDEKQQRDAILVLARMVALGCNKLSSADLEEIATCLYIESDIETSQNVFAILEKYQSELKSTSKEIFEIQGVVLSFRDGTNGKKLESIRSLIRFVESRYRMTASVFQTLIEWTDRFSFSDDSEQCLLRLILEFCEAVLHHEDMVPPFMLQSLSHLEGGRLSVDIQRERSLLVARCLKKNNPVDPVAFPLVEEGFLADVDDREILLYLGALDAIAKQKPVIQPKTIEKLWALLSKNREIYRVAEILMNIFSADTFDKPQAPRHIDQLLSLVGKTSSKKIRKKLTGLIVRLNHFITLELNQFQALYESINATDSFEQQYQLCQLLKLQLSRAVNDFSDAYVKMIAFKEAEKEMIEKSQGLSGQMAHEDIIDSFGTMTAILTSSSHEPSPIADSESESTCSRILEEDNHATTKSVLKTPRLSSGFFVIVEDLLKVFQNRELTQLLDLLKTIEEHQSLPDSIIESLLSLPDQHLDSSFDILECVMKKHHLNVQVLMRLKTLFLETSNPYCRRKSFEILKQTIEWISLHSALSQPQKTISRVEENLTNEDVSVESREPSLNPFYQVLRTLVDVECTDVEWLDIDRIFEHVCGGGELSLGNAEFLLTRFRRGEDKQKILQIFDEVKSKLPRTICQQIFIAYKKEFFSFWYRKYHYFYVNFCCQILIDGKVDPTEEVLLFEELSTNILNSRRMTNGQFDMLFFLAKHKNLQLNQGLVIKMIDFYFFIDDSEIRNKIIYFIFQNLIGLPIWPEELLNRLTSLMTRLEGLQQIEVPTPTSSSQLSTFLGILKNHFSSAVRAISLKSPDFQIDPKEEAPLLLDLLAFVIESEKSAGFFDRFEQRAKLVPISSEDDLTERLKEMISKSDPSPEDQKLFLDLLLMVKRNHPKANYRQVLRILLFKQNEEENNLAEMNELLAIFCVLFEDSLDDLTEHLKEIVSKGSSSPEDQKLFFDLLLKIKTNHPNVDYRQMLRILLFKQNKDENSLGEMSKLLSIFSTISEDSLDDLTERLKEMISKDDLSSEDQKLFFSEEPFALLRGNLTVIRAFFFDRLLSPFPSVKRTTFESKQSLLKVYQKLDWFPIRAKALFGKLSTDATIDELSTLLTLIHDFSISLDVVEDLDDGKGMSVSNLISALKEYLLCQHLVKIALLDSSKAQEVNDRTSEWLRQSVLSAFSLCKQGWSFTALMDWLRKINEGVEEEKLNAIDIRNMSEILTLICSYQEQIGEVSFYTLVEKQFAQGKITTPEILHTYVVDHHLTSYDKIKSLPKLIDEIRSSSINQKDSRLMEQGYIDEIRETLALADQLYWAPAKKPRISGDVVSPLPVNEWSKKQIKKWAGQIKHIDQTSLNSSSSSSHVSFEAKILPECLAVFKRACILLFGHPPREVQLVALLLLAKRTDPKILAQISTREAKSLRGILAQISTGEGKSLIIAMFAALKALQGKKVDVITSSSELAKRDVKDYKPFYELFSLKVASNEDHQYESGMKKCYAKDVDVVYGDPSHFQWDVLRHEYGGLKTRGERGFDLVVMDEVDNVLIESNDSLTMLASPMPCMQELTPLLICLWMRFLHLIELKDNRDLESEESDSSEGIEFGEDSSDIESEKTESSDEIELEDTSSSPESEKKNPFDQVDITDDAAVKKVIETELLSYINMIVEDAEGGMQIPQHLKPFVKSQAKHWIQSAWMAKYQYEEGRDYRIEKNPEDVECIAPVDFANTGAIQLGTSWGEGLQQFLQLNHSLMIEPMTLVTNYSSIYSYIKRYHHRLGITGTLGSSGLQKLLKETYRYDCVEIPTFLPRNRLTLSPQLLQNQELWMEAIVLNAIRDANLGRVVLIICETINTAEELHQRLQDRYAKPSLFLYSDDKNDSKYFLQKEQSPGTIVVATNLAGRGTDIRVSQEVIKKGGLHVCLTFLPADKRVRNQAFGRTSRRGEPGTVQLVLDLQAIKDHFPSCNIAALEKDPKLVKNLPDAQEFEKLEKIKTVHLPNIKQQQKLFRGYLSLLEEIKQIDQAQHSKFGVDRIKKQISVDRIYFEELCEIKRSALEERWGRWLRDILSQEDKTEATNKFLIFKEQMLEAYRQETIIDNPIYYIRLGNQLLNRASRYRHYFSKNNFYEKAIQAYDAAIAMDEIFSFIAYYHRAYAVIQLKRDGYKKNLKENFEKMQQALMNGPLRQHQATYLLLSQYNNASLSFGKDFLNTQFQQQLQVYYLLLDSAKRAVQQIEESQKLIAIDSGVPSFSQTYSEKYTTKRVMKRLGIPPPSGIQAKFRLTFHHLKTHVDINKTSQLKHMIEKIPSQIPITLSFDGDKLYSEQGQKYHLRALLPACQKKIRQNERFMDASSDDRSSTSNPADATSKTASSHQTPVITWADRGADIAAKSTELVSRVSSKVSKAMKSGKHVVVEKIDKFKDWSSSDNGTEAIPATLTIRDLTVKGIRELLEQFNSSSKPAKTTSSETTSKVAPKVDRKTILSRTLFGMGPIKITMALLEHLRTQCSQLPVSVWFPAQRDQEGILKHNEPISVSLSDSILDRPEGEISILECSYDELQNLLDFLSSQDPLLTSNLVLHRLKQATASQWIKIVTSSGTQSLEDRVSESSMQLEWDNGNQKKKSPRSMVLSFVDLDHEQAINIAQMTLAEHNNATLSINEIDADTAQTIIKAADRKEENFSIYHHPIKAELEKICANPSFAVRQQLNGLHYLYDINERNPLPRKGLALLTTLSLLQIAGGVVITTFSGGAGAAAGSALISEGIGDATRIFSAVTNRELDGSTFMLQKSLSVAMSLSSCGLSGLKAVKKTVHRLDGIRSYLMEHGDEMIQVGLTVGKKVLRTTKTAVLDHVKSGVKGFVQGSLKQGVQTTLTTTSGSFLKGVEPSLVQNMKRAIQDMFNKDHWQRTLNKALAVDAFLNSCDEFTIISSKINTLILSAKFNMLDISEFNKKIILQFEKPFNAFLSQRFNHLKDFEDILSRKSIGVTSEEIQAGCAWLRSEKIIDINGEIDLFIIGKYLTPSERPLSKDEEYDVKHYNLDRFTFEHSSLILPACLTYARYLRDDYLCTKREIIEKMTRDFSKELFHNLTTVADLTNEVLHKTAGKMIDKGTEAVSKKFKQDVSRPSRRPPPGDAHSSSRRGFNANSPAPPPMAMETGMAPPPGMTGAPPPGFGDASQWVFKNDSGETVTLPPNAIFFSGTAHPPEGIGAPSPGSSDQLSSNSQMGKDGWEPTGIKPGSNPPSGSPPGGAHSSSRREFNGRSSTPPRKPIGTERAPPSGVARVPPPGSGDQLSSCRDDAGVKRGSIPPSGAPPGDVHSSSRRGFNGRSSTPARKPIGTDRASPPGVGGAPPPRRNDSQLSSSSRIGKEGWSPAGITPGIDREVGESSSSSHNIPIDVVRGSSPGTIPEGKIWTRSGQRNGNRVQGDSSSSFTGGFSLVVESSGDFTIGLITAYFKNKFSKSSQSKEALEKDLLNEAIISSGQKMAELYRKLMSEQIKRLRCVVGLLLVESSSMRCFNKQEEEKLHQNVARIYRLSLEAYESGQDPVIPELRQIGKESKKAEVHVCIRTLEEEWAKYKKLKQKESKVISDYLNQIHPQELLNNTWNLIERKNELGLLAGKGGLSEQMMMQGMVVQQVGNIVQAIIEADKMSDASRERVQCMALKMTKRSLLEQSELQEEILDMKDKNQTLVANIVSQQTEIARIIKENYEDLLKEILKAAQIEDRESRLMKMEEIKTSYHDNLALIDSSVQARVHIVKSNSSDTQFLTDCTKQAALIVTQVIQIAEEMSGKDPREIATLTSEMGQAVQRSLIDGSQVFGGSRSSGGAVDPYSSSSSRIERDLGVSSEDQPYLHSSLPKIAFSYNDAVYQRGEFDTCGDGACALHSLLGTPTFVASIDCTQYIWNPAEWDVNREGDMIQRFAKQTFIDALKPIFHSESHPLKPILFNSVSSALEKTLEFKEWDQQHDVVRRTIKERMRSQLTREFYLNNKEKFDPIFSQTEIEFTGLQNSIEEGAEDIAEKLKNCIDAQIDDLKQAAIDHPNWIQFLHEKENLKRADSEREQRIIEFVQKNFKIYEKLVLDKDYFLDFDELSLAAHLFKPEFKVIVFENEVDPPRIINPEATQEVVIEHTMAYHLHGKHFNRIEVKIE